MVTRNGTITFSTRCICITFCGKQELKGRGLYPGQSLTAQSALDDCQPSFHSCPHIYIVN